ncbi:glycoside hydrolase [Hoeflea sp. WL0058]|uniref:exo-alpha-sialidase n=1 Tax=Flavimaribacter sediminis TaxID=2865987 RepID=A0AAE3D2E4_9HYPH|nr:sialidase family protein [Flavimaribacter sediminis]MBW8639007.1 glycoside hydrolase [Flavimaribacter sediminis]
MSLQDGWDASGGSFPGAGSAQENQYWIVTAAGTVDSIGFALGDWLIATTDDASTSTYAANWLRIPLGVFSFVQGGWETATDYGTGIVLTNDGATYYCTVPHTSGASTEPGTGASWQDYWEVLAAAGAIDEVVPAHIAIREVDLETQTRTDTDARREIALVSQAGAAYAGDVILANSETAYDQDTEIFSNSLDSVSNATTRMGGFARMMDGSFLAISFTSREAVDDFGVGDVNIKKITYDPVTRGLTLGSLVTLYDGDYNPSGAAEESRYIAPITLVERFGANKGRVWVFATWRNEDGSDHKWVGKYSDDHGANWSSLIDFTSQFPISEWGLIAGGQATGVQQSDGRMIVPAWIANPGYPSTNPDNETYAFTYRSILLASDDGGTNWSKINQTKLDELELPNECALASDGAGNLMWCLRDRGLDQAGGRRYLQRVSADGETLIGPTFEAVDDEGEKIVGGQTMAGIIHTQQEHRQVGASPKLVMTQPNSADREDVSIHFSYDGGQTWPVTYLVEAAAGYSFPAVMDHKTLGVLWESYPGYGRVELSIINLASILG